MFKMGCSMAKKILAIDGKSGSSSASSSNVAIQSSSTNPCDSNPRSKGKDKQRVYGEANSTQKAKSSGDELSDFSKLENDPRMPLNVRQIFKITKSWKAIARTMSKTGTAMFLALFEQNQDLFYLFDRFQHLKGTELHESMELREHAATVMSTLDQSINSLSDYDNFVTYLHSIGKLHRKVPGFKRAHFWKIEQPFMKAIKQTLDERCNETIEEIYKIAIKLIIETIAEGYGQDVEEEASENSENSRPSNDRGERERERDREWQGSGGGESKRKQEQQPQREPRNTSSISESPQADSKTLGQLKHRDHKREAQAAAESLEPNGTKARQVAETVGVIKRACCWKRESRLFGANVSGLRATSKHCEGQQVSGCEMGAPRREDLPGVGRDKGRRGEDKGPSNDGVRSEGSLFALRGLLVALTASKSLPGTGMEVAAGGNSSGGVQVTIGKRREAPPKRTSWAHNETSRLVSVVRPSSRQRANQEDIGQPWSNGLGGRRDQIGEAANCAPTRAISLPILGPHSEASGLAAGCRNSIAGYACTCFGPTCPEGGQQDPVGRSVEAARVEAEAMDARKCARPLSSVAGSIEDDGRGQAERLPAARGALEILPEQSLACETKLDNGGAHRSRPTSPRLFSGQRVCQRSKRPKMVSPSRHDQGHSNDYKRCAHRHKSGIENWTHSERVQLDESTSRGLTGLPSSVKAKGIRIWPPRAAAIRQWWRIKQSSLSATKATEASSQSNKQSSGLECSLNPPNEGNTNGVNLGRTAREMGFLTSDPGDLCELIKMLMLAIARRTQLHELARAEKAEADKWRSAVDEITQIH